MTATPPPLRRVTRHEPAPATTEGSPLSGSSWSSPAQTRRLDRGRVSIIGMVDTLGWTAGSLLVAELADDARVVVRAPEHAEAGWVDLDLRCRLQVPRQLRDWLGIGRASALLVEAVRWPGGGALLLGRVPSLTRPSREVQP